MLTAHDIKGLAKELASPRVERLPDASDGERIREAICAFANDLSNSQRPGYVLLGVDSGSGALIGLRSDEQLLRDLSALRNDGAIIPLPNMVVEQVAVGDERVVVSIEVHPSDAPPVRVHGRTLVRTGRRRGPATAGEERTLSERRLAWARTFDARPCLNAALGDLDLELFRRRYAPAMIDAAVLSAGGGGIEEQLASLRFLALASGRPTYAAILAIGKEPAKFVPGAIVQFVRYEGADASTKVLASCELTGTIRELVEETVDELRGQLRTPQPDFPIEALRELLVNAIVHRNYESRQVPVSIRWFRDRIEIQNPGGLYGAVRRENFDRVNDYRNPVVAEAARAFGYVERFGSGISLVQAALRENGNPPADWIFEGTYTLAVVRPRR